MPVTWLTTTSPAHGLTEPEEMAHSAHEEYTNETKKATVKLMCAWDQRHGVLDNILTKLKEWPYQPGSQMYAVSGSIDPFSTQIKADKDHVDGHGCSYPLAILSLSFEYMSGGVGGVNGALFTESIEPNGEHLKLNAKKFNWTSGTGPKVTTEEAGGRLIIGMDYVVKWTRLATIPAAAYEQVDHVNSAPVVSSSLGKTFAAETLLFNAPRISRTVSIVVGQSRYDMECRWSFRLNTWNKFWRQETQSFEEMFYTGSATPYKNFPTANMTGLIP